MDISSVAEWLRSVNYKGEFCLSDLVASLFVCLLFSYSIHLLSLTVRTMIHSLGGEREILPEGKISEFGCCVLMGIKFGFCHVTA